METSPCPGVTIIKDAKGQYMAYVALDALGYASAVQEVGPRFQQLIANGGPVTIFVDHNLELFIFAPGHMRVALALAVSTEHLYDIPGLQQDDQQQQGQLKQEKVELVHRVIAPAPISTVPEHEEPNGSANTFDCVPRVEGDGAAVATVDKHIKRPRNSWIIYRSEKSKQLHQSSANMPVATISTEVARMWAAESVEVREYYQGLANAEAQEHRKKYPEWRYKPGKPKVPA